MSEFGEAIAQAYAAEGAAIDLGRGVLDGALAPEATVQVPLRMMNRHGLIAGATGTGKTITLQMVAEQLSAAGVAVFAADVKGDVSGIAAAGEPGGAAEKRMAELGLPILSEDGVPTPVVHTRLRAPDTGGVDMIGDFLRSRDGKALGKKLARGAFGMLRKRM